MLPGSSVLWLDSKFLKWDIAPDVFETPSNDWNRAYEIWAHANEILSRRVEGPYLSDAITNLKRAVSHRVTILNNNYIFDKLPIRDKPRRRFEQLAFLGIIKPIMLKKLIEIRNAIEHEDASPPSYERCLEFLEFVWYFLRSTDTLSTRILTHFIFGDPESKAGLYVEIELSSDWNIKCRVDRSMCSETEIEDWLLLKVISNETSHFFVEGNIVGPDTPMRGLLTRYFFA